MNDSFYKSVVENSPVGYACHKIICDGNGIPCDYQFIEVNSAFEKFTGIKGSEIISQKITDLIPAIRKETNDWIEYFGDIALNGGNKEYEQFSVPMNKWYRVIVYCPEKGYFVTYFMDLSQEKSQLEELNKFFDLNLDLLCIADNVGNFIKTNRAWETTLGYSSGELSKMKFLDFVHPDDMAITLGAMKLLDGHRDISNFDNRYLSKDGSYHWFEWRSHSQGKLNYSIARDITSRKKLEKIIFDEKELFKTTLLSVCDGVIATDRKGRITIINKVAETLTGWSHEAAYGQPIEKVFHIIDEFTRERCANPIFEILKTSSIVELASHRILVSRDCNELPIKDSVAPIKDENGNIKGMVLVFRDVSDQKQKEDEILHLSYHDYLTGIYNRRFYEKELIRLDTIENLPLTLLIGDVNGLKLINDSLGHAMGDELLKKAAKIITAGCRVDDVVARLGGDEFIVILPRTDIFEAVEIIKRFQNLALKEKVGAMDVSISFGFEIKEKPDEMIEEVFKKAENDMYRHKQYESPSMRGKTVETIIKTLHEKNKREEEHSQRVSKLCESMGKVLELADHKISELKTVGLLHDIGKIVIDDGILNKPDLLTEDEWSQIKNHPEIGYRILNTVNEMSEMAEYVLAHHERWDGSGYPKGLKGEEIPFEARIIGIADAYDAMTSERSYRNALPLKMVLEELENNAGIQFDPKLVRIFIEMIFEKRKISPHNMSETGGS